MNRENYNDLIAKAGKVVVKVGTSSITHETGKLNIEMIEKICRQLVNLHFSGKEVILVTSGAVGAGLSKLGYTSRPKSIPEKQAAAAVGQGILMHIYEKTFSEYGQIVAQLLLTKDDLKNRKRFLNSRNTLLTLLNKNVIPIINENDTVVVEEIKFGDNDTLAALVAGLVNADLLILLTDIDGFYTADPRSNPEASLISVVEQIDDKVITQAGKTGSTFASGGMFTKIEAAKISGSAGIPMIIANSKTENVLNRIFALEPLGTLFLPRKQSPHTRKKWIGFGSEIEGSITVDEGCKKALIYNGKSLLAKGVLDVQGDFGSGSVISIVDNNGEEFARGIIGYTAEEMKMIKGCHSDDFIEILGYKDTDVVIHRDNLLIRY